MTMPHERTRAVIEGHELLLEIMRNLDLPEEVRNQARRVLRHYPMPREVLTAGLIEERYGRGIGGPFFSSTMEYVPADSPDQTRCDVCEESLAEDGAGPQFGLLQAHWHDQSKQNDEQYEVRLCKACFFVMLRYGRQLHEESKMFDDPVLTPNYEFGLVSSSGKADSKSTSDGSLPRRAGFLADQITVPADFNEIGREEIEQTFTHGDREDKT